MLRFLISLFFFSSFTFLAISQNKFSLIVLDSMSKKPISNAIIKTYNNIYYTDSLGLCSFDRNIFDGKEIEIRCLGYETKQILKELKPNEVIYLRPKINNLPELDVVSKSRKLILGHTEKSSSGLTLGDSDIVSTFFANETNTTKFLNKIKIPYRTDGKIVSKLSIHIYSLDNDKKPDKDLLEKKMILTPKKEEGILELNLTNYKIMMPKEGFYIGIEWISPDNALIRADGTKFENDLYVFLNKNVNKSLVYSKSLFYTKNLWQKYDFVPYLCSGNYSVTICLEFIEYD
jgi:hypothetical protein